MQMRIIPLGGLGEIGLNLLILEYASDILVVDAGLMFPKENPLGIDYLIPDFNYLYERRQKIRGYVLTHGHEDHIGALPFLLAKMPAPVFAAPFTLALLREKIKERNQRRHGEHTVSLSQLHTAEPETPCRLGAFRVTFIPVSHSTLGARALFIETPVGNILHTGDYKIDPTTPVESRFDLGVFEGFGARGIQLLMADSTNVQRTGHSPNEATVGNKLRDILAEAPGRVIVGIFSSHIQRVDQVLKNAVETRRKVLLIGKSLERNVELAKKLGFLKIPPSLLLRAQDLRRLPPREICILSTGSQGEMRAVLPRLARKDHPEIKIEPGDTVILGARVIPGNETSIYHMINNFSRMGATVHYGDYADITSSGHAYPDEQRKLIRLLKPRFFLPIHGEYRHLLLHAQLALGEGIPALHAVIAENGEVMELTRESLEKIGRVPSGRLCVFGHHLESTGSSALKERRNLARGGILSAVLARERAAIRLRSFETLGISEEITKDSLHRELEKVLHHALEEKSDFPLQRKIEEGLRRYCRKMWGKKPTVVLHWI